MHIFIVNEYSDINLKISMSRISNERYDEMIWDDHKKYDTKEDDFMFLNLKFSLCLWSFDIGHNLN